MTSTSPSISPLPILLALVLGAAWATVAAITPRLWARPTTRRLPSNPPTTTTAVTTTTRPHPITHLHWITTLGATVRRHTIHRLAPAAPLRGPAPDRGASLDHRTPAVASFARDPAALASADRAANTNDPRSDGRPTAALDHADPAHLATPTHDPHERSDHCTGWAALASLSLLPVAPALAPVPLACALAAPVLAARSARRRHDAALVDQLPDVVDLLSLTTAAGLPVTAALTAISNRPGGPLGAAMGRAAAHIAAGGRLADALAHVSDAGPQARPLVDALAHHDRYGSALQPALERVAIESRARRRRHAEEAARRLPVALLFPLLLTTFPAFVALTVVPLLAGSLGSLSL